MFQWVLRLRGPEATYQTSVTVRHCVYFFGSSKLQIDVHIFNTVALNWRKLTPVAPESERCVNVPSMWWGYTTVLVQDDTVLIWGGRLVEKYNNVLYGFDVDAHRWFKPQVSGTLPEGRSDCSACVLGKAMYVHGGWLKYTGTTNDTYKLDAGTMVWSLINIRGISPPASAWHSATIIGTKMFVFGGWNGREDNSLRVFDTENDRWLDTPSTQLHPRRGCDHASFAHRGELYIGGGRGRMDMWKLNPDTFSGKVVKTKGKGPYGDEMRYCSMMGEHVVVFGKNFSRDLYILDLNPSLKTLCKLGVFQHSLEQSELPHDLRWELAAMTANTVTEQNTKT